MTRRSLFRAAGAAAPALLLGACGIGGAPVPSENSTGLPHFEAGRLLGYSFGTKKRDLTIFDVASRRPLGTWPLGATVRWLSNEQTFWDGQFIWTYDFPNNSVQAIAIDPLRPRVARSIATAGTGPAHSLMLTPDRLTAWVNIAGSNELAVIDLRGETVVDRVTTGEFP